MPYQVMYSSQATKPMTITRLEEILEDARTGNEARNVTGVLVYVDGVFLQIIEGDKDIVLNLMANIASDSRHRSVKVFYEAEVDAQAFESWSMAYLSPTAEEMSTWLGLPGTSSVEELLASVDRDPQRVPPTLVSVLKALALK
jgi:hypothetical protein